MGKTYPDNFDEEYDRMTVVPMLASYALPEFMGITEEDKEEEEEGDV